MKNTPVDLVWPLEPRPPKKGHLPRNRRRKNSLEFDVLIDEKKKIVKIRGAPERALCQMFCQSLFTMLLININCVSVPSKFCEKQLDCWKNLNYR